MTLAADRLVQLQSVLPVELRGSIVRTEGLVAAAAGFPAPIGAVAEISRRSAELIAPSSARLGSMSACARKSSSVV